MECSAIKYPVEKYDCMEIPNQISGVFPSLLKETVNRLCKHGLFPIMTSLGYAYMKDIHGKIIGTSIPIEYDAPKSNDKLTKKERKELSYFPFLLNQIN